MQDTEKPLPLRALLTRPVVVSVANSGVISLLDMAASALIPLVWSMPVEFGGLSMSPVAIGLWVAAFGSVNGIFQFVAFPPFARRFGTRRVFIVCVIFFFPIYILFPFQNLALRQSSRGGSLISLLLIALQLSVASFADMGFCTSLNISRCAWSLKTCGSISCNKYVHIFCRTQQAISRRNEWTRANGCLDSAHDRTCCCRIVVFFLTRQ